MSKTHEQFKCELELKNPLVILIGKYTKATDYVKVKCCRCNNIWEAKAYSLLQGRACPKCRVIRGIENNKGKTHKKTHDEFQKKLKQINNGITLLSEYKSHHDFVLCKCNRCEYEWEVKAYSLLQGHGCPKCAKSGTSFMEQFLYLSFVRIIGNDEVLSRDRKTIGMELDIYIPKYNFALEPGNWNLHKNNIERDRIKREKCSDKNIDLITIYDMFPKDSLKPFDKNCYIFTDDLNKMNHVYLKQLVNELCNKYSILNNLSEEDYTTIENEAYENSKSMTHDIFCKRMSKVHPNIQIIDKYVNSNKRIKVKCNICGFEWSGVPFNMLAGDGCRKCGTKKAHEKFLKEKDCLINELKNINPDIEIIGEYTGRHSKIKTRCKICGFEWEPVVSSLLRGSSHKNSKSMHNLLK